jgi:hypothetical protein
MTLVDLEAIVRGLEARVAKLEAQLRSPAKQQAKASAAELPSPVIEPALTLEGGQDDQAGQIGRQFVKSTRGGMKC